MKQDKYELESDRNFLLFEFTSIAPKGRIKKLVQYSKINLKHYYNLGFGDKDEATGEIDDLSITNNCDSKKVLATVAFTLYVFTQKNPGAHIFAVGSTIARTRLYRMGITNNLLEIKQYFEVFGLLGKEWHAFEPGMNYKAFLIRRKKQ